MLELLEKLKEWILDLFLPKKCLGCEKEGRYICDKCEVFLSEAPPLKEAFSVWEYEGLVEKLIREIKFQGRYHIIDELVEKAFQKIDLRLPEDTIITFVPMWSKKEKERGFNQSELIAKKLGRCARPRLAHLPFKVAPLLMKIKDNKSQVGLNLQERIENVKAAFRLNFQFSIFNFQNILLVDDVYTTGATVKECVRVLKKAGAKNVWVFTLARKLNL